MNKKKVALHILAYIVCFVITYFLFEKFFWRLEYEIRDGRGNQVLNNLVHCHIGTLLLLILWELKKLNAKFGSDEEE